jgi:acetyltransferase-like isoleucine patch superfamily enzyme
VQIGPDVIIEARSLSIGDEVQIGVRDADDFRFPCGVRIHVEELILASQVRIAPHVLIRGGRVELGRRVKIRPESTVRVTRKLVIGSGGTVNQGCELAGVNIEMGRELWMLPEAKVGGGSAFEVHSSLKAGNWLHIGTRCFLNTARPITLGDEVGLGTGTSLYTHGAYPSALEGKPVAFGPISIGHRTWLPGAIVNPSVRIGSDCVIGVGSVVTRDVPDGSLAAGIPAKVLRENVYPAPLTGTARSDFFADFLKTFSEICSDRSHVSYEARDGCIAVSIDQARIAYLSKVTAEALQEPEGQSQVMLTDQLDVPEAQVPPDVTLLECRSRRIVGPATPLTDRLLNQLRRYGIRFNYDSENGRYVAWE